jgi:hypothetical protein
MVTGVKSVDFAITAKGHGVVNWNGAKKVNGHDNHTVPKLMNMPFGSISETIDFGQHPLYVSSNCVRHFLFRDQNYDGYAIDKDGTNKLIASLTGLVRGYMHAKSGIKRKSPLMIENFVDTLGKGNTFEQFVSSSAYVLADVYKKDDTGKVFVDADGKKIKDEEKGEKGVVIGQESIKSDASIFSKTTFLDTAYTAYGSIAIEDLAFICADTKYGRSAVSKIKDAQQNLMSYFEKHNNLGLKPAVSIGNYHRVGSAVVSGKETSETGLLLNDNAIHIVLVEFFDRLNSLYIQQAKGYLYVDSLHVHFNKTDMPMAIKRFPGSGEYSKDWQQAKSLGIPSCGYARYYYDRTEES